MTLLRCTVSCGGACNVFEASVSRSGGHVPSARRGRPERNGILAERGRGMDAGVYSSIQSHASCRGARHRENRRVLLVSRNGWLLHGADELIGPGRFDVGRPALVNAALLRIQATMRGRRRTQLPSGKLTTAFKKRSQDAPAICRTLNSNSEL